MPTTISGSSVSTSTITGTTSVSAPTINLTGGVSMPAATTAVVRAWANFNGTDGSRRASFNISGITRNSLGAYTVTFATALEDANYAVSGIALWTGGPYIVAHSNTFSTSSFVLITGATGGSGADLSIVSFMVVR